MSNMPSFECCEPLKLFSHIDNKRFTEAASHLQSHFKEAMFHRFGWTCLHLSCQKSAPLDLIEALLAVNPDATSKMTHTSFKTPLHIAAVKCSVPTLMKLLKISFATVDARDKNSEVTTIYD